MSIDISKKSIIICGILRNAEKGLKRNIPVVNALCNFFKDYHIVIYENDSTDNTKIILKEWSKSNPEKIHVILENTVKKESVFAAKDVRKDPFIRTRKLGECRNRYLTHIEEQGWQADYLMVIDMDVAKIDVDAILTSFSSDVEWDAVAAFGYSMSPQFSKRYHDTFALTEYGDENNPQTHDKVIELADKYGKLKPTDPWVRVYAAFCGIAIYKFEALKGFRYVTYTNNDPIVKCRCEHYSAGKYMAERGFDKFYINPAMVLKYQDLTWKIVLNTIKRKLGV